MLIPKFGFHVMLTYLGKKIAKETYLEKEKMKIKLKSRIEDNSKKILDKN